MLVDKGPIKEVGMGPVKEVNEVGIAPFKVVDIKEREADGRELLCLMKTRPSPLSMW